MCTFSFCYYTACLVTVWWQAFDVKPGCRYLMMEFPCLMQPHQHIFEIGCGCGSSLLPILKANITSRVTATDLSPTAVRLFCEAAEMAGIDRARYEAFPLDAAAADANHLTPTGELPLSSAGWPHCCACNCCSSASWRCRCGHCPAGLHPGCAGSCSDACHAFLCLSGNKVLLLQF